LPVQTIGSADELADLTALMELPSALVSADATFRSKVDHRSLGDGVTVATAETATMRLRRGARQIAASARDDLLMLCIHLDGAARVRQHDRLAELGPGDAVLFESRRPSDVEYPRPSRTLSLQFPRSLLEPSAGRLDDRCARTLPATTPALALLTGYLRQLHAVALPAAVQPAVDLLALALGGEPDRAATLRADLRQNLADPTLTVATLARRHHLSPRRLHELFATGGGTPAAYLRALRLRAAQRALADPGRRGHTVARIAASVGFREVRSFERAFTREFGMSPGAYRRMHG
jgi:AraC-like DNA-binding protein